MSALTSTKVRIIDIAQRIGVSKATVARVLNQAGKNTIRVSDTRKQEILEVARELHYVPNHVAQTLAGKSNMRIGLLIDRGASACIQRIMRTIEELAEESGYQVMVGQAHDDPLMLRKHYDNFQVHGVDGVICLCPEYPGLEDTVRSCFQSVVNIVYLGAPQWEAPYASNDYDIGTIQAMRHLQETGKERILLWLPKANDFGSCRSRTQAYHTCNLGEDHVLSGNTEQEVYAYMVKHHVDGVLADSDIMAAKLMRELLSHGVRIPEDVAIIGNNNDEFTSCIYPSLSTIDHHENLLAEQLFQTLMEVTGVRQPTPHDLVKTSLIIRESSQTSRNRFPNVPNAHWTHGNTHTL